MRRQGTTSQFNPTPRVNMKHPLCRGITACFTYPYISDVTRRIYNLVPGYPQAYCEIPAGVTTGYLAGRRGLATTDTSQHIIWGGYGVNYKRWDEPLTTLHVVSFKSTPATYMLMSCSSTWVNFIQSWTTSDGKIWYDSSGDQWGAGWYASVSNLFSITTPHCYTMYRNNHTYPNNITGLWVDGINVMNCLTTDYTGLDDHMWQSYQWGGGNWFQGIRLIDAWWNRILSDQEIRDLHKDPYQILEYQSSFYFQATEDPNKTYTLNDTITLTDAQDFYYPEGLQLDDGLALDEQLIISPGFAFFESNPLSDTVGRTFSIWTTPLTRTVGSNFELHDRFKRRDYALVRYDGSEQSVQLGDYYVPFDQEEVALTTPTVGIEISDADSVSLSDLDEYRNDVPISAFDTLQYNLLEAQVLDLIGPYIQSHSDTISLSDLISAVLAATLITRSLSDSFTLTDAVVVSRNVSRSISDRYTLVDSIKLQLNTFLAKTDAYSLSDLTSAFFNAMSPAVADSINNFLDAVTSSTTIQLTKSFADSLTVLTDAVAKTQSTSSNNYLRRYLNDVN